MAGEIEPRTLDNVVDLRLLGYFMQSQSEQAAANTTPVEEQNPLFPPLTEEQLAINARGMAAVRAAHLEGKARFYTAHGQPQYGELRLVR